MSTETLEAPAAEAAEPEMQTAPEPAPGAEVAVRANPASMALGAKMKYAQMLAESGLLPAAYRRQPANVLYAVEYGQMLGLQPMAAITGIHIIEGKPSASAGLISALVRRAGHKLRVTGNAKSATCQIIRSDDPAYTYEVTWTLRKNADDNPDAETAGLLGKSVWKQYPSSMLKSRAITQCARDACEEALFGLHYTPEELGAEVDDGGSVITGQFAEDDDTPAPAPVVTDQPWLDSVHERAATVGEANYVQLWKEAAEGCHTGKCTKAEMEHAQALIAARMEDVRRTDPAAEGDVVDADVVDGVIVQDEPGLPAEDPWATAVEDIAGEEDAAAARANLRTSLNAGTITSERFQQVLDAIDARLSDLQVAA